MVLFATLALAGPLPMDEADALDARALALLDGPPGCWELVGKAGWDWSFSRFGALKGDAVFAGRMVDGVWRAFALFPNGETVTRRKESDVKRYTAEERFRPLVGELSTGRVSSGSVASDEPPVNALDDFFDELSENVWTSEVSAGPGHSAVVERRVAMDGGNEALLTATFPNREAGATALDLVVPDGFPVKDAPLGTRVAPGATAQIRGRMHDGALVPTAERFAFTVKWMGLSFEGAQRIDYTRVTPCTE